MKHVSEINRTRTIITAASHTCAFGDGPSTHTARACILDKGGGYSEYTTVVH